MTEEELEMIESRLLGVHEPGTTRHDWDRVWDDAISMLAEIDRLKRRAAAVAEDTKKKTRMIIRSRNAAHDAAVKLQRRVAELEFYRR